MPTKTRYIASAVCPQCKLEDKIRLCIEEQDERIECVNCGYVERKSDLLKQQQTVQDEKIIQWFPSKKQQAKQEK